MTAMPAWMVTMIKMDDTGVEKRIDRVHAKTSMQAKRMVEVRRRADQRDAMGNTGWVFESAVKLEEPGGSDADD